MSLSSLADHDETLEVLVHVRQDHRGNIVCHFVDASGNKVLFRLNPQAAQDLFDELGDVCSGA